MGKHALGLPETTTKETDAFQELVELCIEAYRTTLSDTVALDANGVLGKQRVMILDDERYQRETKVIKARRTIDDLQEIQALSRELSDDDDDEDEDNSGIVGEFDTDDEDEEEFQEEEFQEAPFADYDVTLDLDDFDIRNKEAYEKERQRLEQAKAARKEEWYRDQEKKRHEWERKEQRRRKEWEKEQEKKRKERAAKKNIINLPKPKKEKIFDKAKMDMKLKLFQQRREVLASMTEGEEKEGDALNIFFVPVTQEEFEKIGTTEVSSGVSSAANAFDAQEEDEIAKRIKLKKSEEGLVEGGSAFHYEEIDGEMVVVED